MPINPSKWRIVRRNETESFIVRFHSCVVMTVPVKQRQKSTNELLLKHLWSRLLCGAQTMNQSHDGLE